MKKKLLFTAAFAVMGMFLATLASCKKEAVLQSNSKSDSVIVEETLNENDEESMGERDTPYGAAYKIATRIVGDIDCGYIYYLQDMYCLGRYGSSYIFCVPCDFQNSYLIVLPTEETAFAIYDPNGLSKQSMGDGITIQPSYDYEIWNEASTAGFKLCDGTIYPHAYGFYTTSFVVSHVYTPTYPYYDLSYNLSNMYSNLAVGTYSYQGITYNTTSTMTLDDFLYSVTMNIYYHFY